MLAEQQTHSFSQQTVWNPIRGPQKTLKLDLFSRNNMGNVIFLQHFVLPGACKCQEGGMDSKGNRKRPTHSSRKSDFGEGRNRYQKDCLEEIKAKKRFTPKIRIVT